MEDKKKIDESPEQRRPDEKWGRRRHASFQLYVGIQTHWVGASWHCSSLSFWGNRKNASWTDIDKLAKKGHIDRFIVVNPKEAYVYIKRFAFNG